MMDVRSLDLHDRDPASINAHLEAVTFEKVLGEPDGVHSLSCVWSASYCCFNCWESCCYKTLTLLCGIFVAACWGCTFAYLTCQHVWCITPYIKTMEISCGACQRIFNIFLSCVFAPVCETFGLCLSKIKVLLVKS